MSRVPPSARLAGKAVTEAPHAVAATQAALAAGVLDSDPRSHV